MKNLKARMIRNYRIIRVAVYPNNHHLYQPKNKVPHKAYLDNKSL
jgi:hypothetical protein